MPFSFPVTSHISITFAVRIGLWGALYLFGLSTFYSQSMGHLLPNNVGVLGPFIILVELVSSLVRPLTLAFRLAANITAGHVILGLAAGLAANMRGGIIIPILYYAFEVIVRWVQAYVFLLLIVFYTNDYVSFETSL